MVLVLEIQMNSKKLLEKKYFRLKPHFPKNLEVKHQFNWYLATIFGHLPSVADRLPDSISRRVRRRRRFRSIR